MEEVQGLGWVGARVRVRRVMRASVRARVKRVMRVSVRARVRARVRVSKHSLGYTTLDFRFGIGMCKIVILFLSSCQDEHYARVQTSIPTKLSLSGHTLSRTN